MTNQTRKSRAVPAMLGLLAFAAGAAVPAVIPMLGDDARAATIRAANGLFDPRVLLPVSVLLFAALLWGRRAFANGTVAAAAAGFVTSAFAVSLLDRDFHQLVTQPDNIAILLMLGTLGLFGWLALRRAVVDDDLRARGITTRLETEAGQRVLTWPDLVYIELLCGIFIFVGLIFWSIWVKAPLEAPANPAITPNPSKAPWYFVGLQELLVYFDPWLAGVTIPLLIIFGLMAIPYLDRNPKGSGYYGFRDRKFAISTFLFGFLILWVLLIFLGTFLRGPGWNFFGPYETWDRLRMDPLANVNLSELFWVRFLNRPLPASALLRELPGLAFVVFYYGVLPGVLKRTVMRRMRIDMGRVRFAIMIFLLLTMGLLPLKMVLRWSINLKYIVAFPEWALNL